MNFITGAKQDEIIHLLENGAHKQRKSSGYHDQNRHQQEHGEIVRNLAIHGSCFFTSQIRLKVISILLTRLITVHNNITKPTPMKIPPLVCER